jgi:hypothetical protein
MTIQVTVPMRYLHEQYFGRPCCPKCGELIMAPEYPEFSECLTGVEIRSGGVSDARDKC